METLIKTLQNIGISNDEIENAVERYNGDLDGFRNYVLIERLMFDDRNEYI